MKCRSICSVTSKSAMTPSLSGRIAEIVPGVRPSIRFASMPTACTSPVRWSIATTDGSERTMPRPRTYTSVFAVPRSTAMSRPPNPVSELKMPIGVVAFKKAAAIRGPGRGRSLAADRVLSFRHRVEQSRHRQPHHVGVVALDGGHQRRPHTLYRIAARPALPLAGGDVPRDVGLVQLPEANVGRGQPHVLARAHPQAQSGVHGVAPA